MSFHLLLCLLQARLLRVQLVRPRNPQFKVGICPCLGMSNLAELEGMSTTKASPAHSKSIHQHHRQLNLSVNTLPKTGPAPLAGAQTILVGQDKSFTPKGQNCRYSPKWQLPKRRLLESLF